MTGRSAEGLQLAGTAPMCSLAQAGQSCGAGDWAPSEVRHAQKFPCLACHQHCVLQQWNQLQQVLAFSPKYQKSAIAAEMSQFALHSKWKSCVWFLCSRCVWPWEGRKSSHPIWKLQCLVCVVSIDFGKLLFRISVSGFRAFLSHVPFSALLKTLIFLLNFAKNLHKTPPILLY